MFHVKKLDLCQMGFPRHPTQYGTCDAPAERPPGDEEALRRLTVRLQTEASNKALMYPMRSK